VNKRYCKPAHSNSIVVLIIAICVVITGCSSNPKIGGQKKPIKGSETQSAFLCTNANYYANTVVGTGHCVSLIRKCSGAPHTSHWKPGHYVLGLPSGSIRSGSIIATFLNGKYPNKTGWHAAIYISHNQDGIWVWDQWLGQPVHRRFIRYRTDKAAPANSAQDYRVVLF